MAVPSASPQLDPAPPLDPYGLAVADAVSRLRRAIRRAALEQALPALGELTGALDALADESQAGLADDLSLTHRNGAADAMS
ncbi:MAG: hypothetical protein M3Y33_22310 [Actinomycetota bacterium]|nr:hypothetical protein [Actinomycetota bacterium]